MSTTRLNHNQLKTFLQQVELPHPESHKGQNGKLLIIGGSHLFHAASNWSLDIASRFVDMVFYSSVPENNRLINEAKQNFWNGIVVPRDSVEDYFQEADCVLIGPGMERSEQQNAKLTNGASAGQNKAGNYQQPTQKEWETDTAKISNYLLDKYSNKKWVIDAGALQMMDPRLLTDNCIITPHIKELKRMLAKINQTELLKNQSWQQISQALNQATILLKGKLDRIITPSQVIEVEGGNAGMTKGGTGDVLAGLVSGLYTNSPILPSCVIASYTNKAAGDFLYQKVGPYFNASDLLKTIPGVLWNLLEKNAVPQP